MGKRKVDSELHRIKLETGTVYQTQKGGTYYFRYQINGERKCISLKTANQEEAMLELARHVDEKTFQAFELYALESKPVKETAELVGLSVNSVYVAKTRCIKILRGIVARLNAEDPELKLDV